MDYEYLYVIGNGFDIHHGINSKYSDFRAWLESGAFPVLDDFDEVYGGVCDEDWWSDFENNIARLNVVDLAMEKVEENPVHLMDEHCDNTWNDAEIAVENQLNDLYRGVRSCFHDWIMQLDKYQESKKINLNVDKSLFFTFNYTKTLEELYKIKRENILHIHGCVDVNEEFILGHGEDAKSLRERAQSKESEEKRAKLDVATVSEQGAEDAVIRGVLSQKKDVVGLINKNLDFFNKLSKIKEIAVFGFSFSKVDMPYLDKIVHSINKSKVKWIISDYNSEKNVEINSFVHKYSICNYQIIKNLKEYMANYSANQ